MRVRRVPEASVRTNRSLKDFCASMALRGKGPRSACAVATLTRWNGRQDEIRRLYKEHGKEWKRELKERRRIEREWERESLKAEREKAKKPHRTIVIRKYV